MGKLFWSAVEYWGSALLHRRLVQRAEEVEQTHVGVELLREVPRLARVLRALDPLGRGEAVGGERGGALARVVEELLELGVLLPVLLLHPRGDVGAVAEHHLLERVEERDAIGVVRPVPSGFVRNSTMGSLSWKNVSRAKAKAALAAFSPGAIAMAADGTPPPQTGGTFNTDGTARSDCSLPVKR